jgi:HAD superfamily hydrolase (TIGR01509 family)
MPVQPRAILFDFNGTLSDDEPILYAIYAELFAEQGEPLSAQSYLERLAGLSEREIFTTWLGSEHPGIDRLIADRVARYRSRVSDGSTVSEPVRAAVRHAAARVPVGIVSGAAREEIEPVVRSAGLERCISFVVAGDEVEAGKPDPESYLRALELLGDPPAAAVVAFEDTEAGVASAKAAGLRVIALTGTLGPERLAQADVLVGAIEPATMRRLLGDG